MELWLFVNFLLLNVAAAFDLSISPTHIHSQYRVSTRYVKVTCKSSIPLTHCQFRVDRNNPRDISSTNNASQTGRGYLLANECVEVLDTYLPQFSEPRGYQITCRVRNEFSGWKYASMALVTSNTEGINIDMQPRIIVLHLHPTQTVNLKITPYVKHCGISLDQWLTGVRINNFGIKRSFSSIVGSGVYSEPQLNSTCELTFYYFNAETVDGLTWMKLEMSYSDEISNSYSTYNFVQVVVAKIPDRPNLTNYSVVQNGNGTLTLYATCIVTGAKPIPNIQWILDGQPILGANVVNVPENRWLEPNDIQNVQQKLTAVLDERDSGKQFWCSASHILLGDSVLRSKLLTIPKPTATPGTPTTTRTLPNLRTSTSLIDSTTNITISAASAVTTLAVTTTTSNAVTNQPSSSDAPSVSTVFPPTNEASISSLTTIASLELDSTSKTTFPDTGDCNGLIVIGATIGNVSLIIIAILLVYIWLNKYLCFAVQPISAKEEEENPGRGEQLPLSLINAHNKDPGYLEPVARAALNKSSDRTENVIDKSLRVPETNAPPRPPEYDYVYSWRKPIVLK